MATNLFYVYLHRKKSNNDVFYVGKGFGKRAWKKTSRSEYWKRIENKHGRIVEIVKDGLQENEAFELEKEVIAFYGRKNLCNLNDGGYGGTNPSKETRLKMSIAGKGKIVSEETREKKRIAATGKKHSEKTKEKLRKINLGKKRTSPVTDEERKKRSESQKGKIISPETCKRISEAKKGKAGKKLTDEAKNNLRLANTGRILSEESKKKIGDANRGRKHTPEALEKIIKKNRETNAKMKKPIKASNGMCFDSASDAAKWLRENGYLSASSGNITSCCTNKLKSAYGLTWCYN